MRKSIQRVHGQKLDKIVSYADARAALGEFQSLQNCGFPRICPPLSYVTREEPADPDQILGVAPEL
ncbi:unnamed protein product, partial [Allacma fusca]